MVRPTSAEAYQFIRDRGLLSGRQWEVYDTVYRFGPLTGSEIFRKLDEQRPSGRGPLAQSNVHARLNELREQHALKELGVRKCTVTGRDVIAWEVTGRIPDPPVKKPLGPTRAQLEQRAARYRLALEQIQAWAEKKQNRKLAERIAARIREIEETHGKETQNENPV